ncbi:recombinase family protein [Isoptericola sp. NPDC058082]|uniref:recombinase family protein n=1 Tax=Isoptericola sp. NPDC058082 TaxID=3346331 RepID=UPI0036EFCA27
MVTSPESSPLPAAIYVRISRDKAGAGLGVDRQEADCRALAERLGWNVVAVYADNDISAYSGKPRPQYRAMLDAVKTGKVRGVVAWHTDRLHRRTLELEEFVTLAETHHLQVQTVTAGTLDLSTASGRMVARMLGAAAQHEVDHARERMQRKRAQMAANGEYRGGPRPFGYEKDGYTVRESEAEVIRQATEAILAGRTLAAVARDLNAQGSTTSTGNAWSYMRLRDMLARPRNAGLLHRGKVGRQDMQIVGPALWPAVVDEDTWRALHARLIDPSRRKQDGNDTRWLGSGIYRCGRCGSSMRVTAIGGTGAKRGGKRVYHYRCQAAAHLTIAQGLTDRHIVDVVARHLQDPRVVAAMTPDTEDGTLAEAREQRAVLVARLEGTERDYDEDLIDARRYAAKRDKITAELAEVDARLVAATQQTMASPIAGAVDPAEAFRAAPVDIQRAVLREILTVEVLPSPRRGMQWSSERLNLSLVKDPDVEQGDDARPPFDWDDVA